MENLEADMICLSKEYKEKHSPGGRKMRCPYCGSENSRVIDSRHSEDNNSIRRRRQCDDCSKRFTTYEKIETEPLQDQGGYRTVLPQTAYIHGTDRSDRR